MFPISRLGGVSLAVVASLVLLYRRQRKARSLYPPGPKGYPVIGSILDIPQNVPLWKAVMSMGEKYGEWMIVLAT